MGYSNPLRCVTPYVSPRSSLASAVSVFLFIGCVQAQASYDDCSLHEVSRERLIMADGRQLYVEPVVLEANSGGDVLLAGTYNHLFEKTAEGEWEFVARDSVFGALIPKTGAPQVVPSPLPGKLLKGIRAAASDDGTWAVVFAEVRPDTGNPDPQRAARLWYGVLDGVCWTTIESLPLPPGGTVEPIVFASSLARRADALGWALPVDRRGLISGILVYERRGGEWTHEVVPTGFAKVDLSYSDTLGLVLAVRQGDFRLRRDANSLLFWVRQPEWRILRSVVRGSEEQVHRPSLIITPERSTLTWMAEVNGMDGLVRYEAHAMIGSLEKRNEPIITLDSAVVPAHPISFVPLTAGPRVWVTDHLLAGGEDREIRFVRESSGLGVVLGRSARPRAACRRNALTPGARAVWLNRIVSGSVRLSRRDRTYNPIQADQNGHSRFTPRLTGVHLPAPDDNADPRRFFLHGLSAFASLRSRNLRSS